MNAMNQNLLVELFVEELPPKALKKLGEAFGRELRQGLIDERLVQPESNWTWYATPRRLAVHICNVESQQSARVVREKLLPVSVGLDANNNFTPALIKKMTSKGMNPANYTIDMFERVLDGKNETLFLPWTEDGFALAQVLGDVLERTLAKLPIPKVMTYQMSDGWTDVKFVRPVHSLLVLHGDQVVEGVRTHDNNLILGLQPSRITQGHRFEATNKVITIKNADSYEAQMRDEGAVIASYAARRASIVSQLAYAANQAGQGLQAIEDEALLDEVTALVERPNVLTCQFEAEFLGVPQECLILTMKANQKYFPLLDSAGKLANKFLVVSNITPDDASFVIGGNERVVRPRLADAKFFFDQDRKKTLESRVEGLSKVVYHNKLGTQGERMARVCAIAQAIGQQVGGDALAVQAEQVARLAKTDLLTDMVGEFPELQGIMGGYYARHDGLGEDVAKAIEDHYKPRFAGDQLPRNTVGVVVALADKLETLVGMFGIGNVPTGDKDPFALRRHALGLIRMLIEKDVALGLPELLALSAPVFGDKVTGDADALIDFIYDRLSGSLREQGYFAQEVDAVMALRPERLSDVAKRLEAVRAFAALPESAALASANKRVGNILKKVEGTAAAAVNPALLKETAEIDLHTTLAKLQPESDKAYEQGDYAKSLALLAKLKAPVDAFFEHVMVNADDAALKANRLGLLSMMHAAMNRVADLSKLAN